MSSQKFKTNSYCVGGRRHSSTTNFTGDKSINKKTGKEVDLLIGRCSICNRKISMVVSDNVIRAENLGDFFKNLGKNGLIVSKIGKKRVK